MKSIALLGCERFVVGYFDESGVQDRIAGTELEGGYFCNLSFGRLCSQGPVVTGRGMNHGQHKAGHREYKRLLYETAVAVRHILHAPFSGTKAAACCVRSNEGLSVNRLHYIHENSLGNGVIRRL